MKMKHVVSDSVYMISRRMYNNDRLRIVGNDISLLSNKLFTHILNMMIFGILVISHFVCLFVDVVSYAMC